MHRGAKAELRDGLALAGTLTGRVSKLLQCASAAGTAVRSIKRPASAGGGWWWRRRWRRCSGRLRSIDWLVLVGEQLCGSVMVCAARRAGSAAAQLSTSVVQLRSQLPLLRTAPSPPWACSVPWRGGCKACSERRLAVGQRRRRRRASWWRARPDTGARRLGQACAMIGDMEATCWVWQRASIAQRSARSEQRASSQGGRRSAGARVGRSGVWASVGVCRRMPPSSVARGRSPASPQSETAWQSGCSPIPLPPHTPPL